MSLGWAVQAAGVRAYAALRLTTVTSMPKRKADNLSGYVRGPVKARSTWPTSFLSRQESQEWLSKTGHYETAAAYVVSGRDHVNGHAGTTAAVENGLFGPRIELLMFPNGKIRLMGALYPAKNQVDEDGDADESEVSGIVLNGHVGVSPSGRSVLTTLQDGFISEGGAGYGTPHRLTMALKVLSPGQSLRVEQCPFESAERKRYKVKADVDREGMLKMKTGPGDLIVKFSNFGGEPVVHYMKRKHEAPVNCHGEPADDDKLDNDDLDSWWEV